MVESWGCTRAEALEMVTHRAVSEARRVAEHTRTKPDRAALERHLAYLDELRDICLAATRSTSAVG